MQRLLFVLVTSFLPFSLVFSQSVEETMQFAEEQFRLGNYTNSVLAYERAIYFEEGTTSDTYFNLAEAYFKMGNVARALRFYDNATFLEPDNEKRNAIVFKKSLAYLSIKEYNQAIISLGAINDFNDEKAKLKKQYFKSIAYFLKEDFDQFDKLFDQYVEDMNLMRNSNYINLENYNQKADRVKPNLAMWMSVFVPGSGQILYGNWKDGLNSMALTAALAGLYFNYILQFSVVEGYLVILPWFQRYHEGGYLKAKETAKNKEKELRSKAYREILQMHPALF